MIRLFLVTIDVPDGATIAEMEQYIEEAVSVWAGSKDQTEKVHRFDRSSVKVRRVQSGDTLK